MSWPDNGVLIRHTLAAAAYGLIFGTLWGLLTMSWGGKRTESGKARGPEP